MNIRLAHHLYIKPSVRLLCRPKSLRRAWRMYQSYQKHRRFLSTLPRSGTNYISSLISSAVDLAHGGDGDYFYENDEWVFPNVIGFPCVWHNYVECVDSAGPGDELVYFHAHHPVQQQNMINLRSAKTIFTVRDIHNQLESWLFHNFQSQSRQDHFIQTGHVEKTIEYFNYWGAFRDNNSKARQCLCVAYENLIDHPLDVLSEIVTFWQLDIPADILETAVGLCSRERMKSKIPENVIDNNRRVSVRTNREDVFTEHNRHYIENAIASKLQYDFGYKY